MNGHIRQRSPGSWELRYRADGKTCTATFKGTKGDASKELRRLLSQVDKGTHASSGAMTVETWLREWLGKVAIEKTPGTLRRYASDVETYLVPALGSHRLDRLTPRLISAFYGSLPSTLGPRSRRLLHQVLSGALRRAVKIQLLSVNPCAGLSEELPRIEKREMAVLSPEQCRDLLGRAVGTICYSPVLVALATGARRGEVLGLRWRNVDLDKRLILITEQSQRGGPNKRPKGEKVRSVTLPASYAEMLRAHKSATG